MSLEIYGLILLDQPLLLYLYRFPHILHVDHPRHRVRLYRPWYEGALI